MSQLAATLRVLFPGIRVGRPSIPHEHDAWVILYAPLRSNKLPPLKRVGLAETFYSLWFAVFFIASLVVHR